MGEQAAQETGVRLHAERDRLRQGRPELAQGGRAVGAVRDDLGEHRVVEAADLRALREARVGADAVALGLAQPQDPAAGGEEAAGRVLGADPGLHGVPGQPYVLLREAEGLPGRDPQLPLDQVQARDQLGHRVLHLEAGVHLHEVVRRRVRARDDELHRARAPVAAGAGRLDRRLAHRRTRLLVEEHARRLLDDLLVAALEGALALAQVDHVAVAVGQDLDLDVAGAVDPALDEERVVVEGGAGLAAGGGDLVLQAGQVPHQAHALAAAARAGLQQHRRAQLAGRLRQVRVAAPGDDRHARVPDRLLGADLVAHQRDRVRRRTDEDQAGVGAGAREGGVLGEEAVARVDGLRARAGRGLQQALHRQVALGRRGRADPHRRVRLADVPGVGVRVGEDGHRAHAHRPQRPDDAYGDLATVGHQHCLEHRRPSPHIRKTPNWGSPRGALAHAVRARPRTWRVSSGSITPSSQRRAVA